VPLDPLIAQLLEMGRSQPKISALPVAEAREAMVARVALMKPLAPADVVTKDLVTASSGGPMMLRLYHPPAAPGPLPVLVWLHGGGWVIGSIETHDALCRFLCKEGPLLVVAVEYRLAPESRSPAQQRDVLDALRWTAATIADHGGDPDHIIVGGDSAGGNLAALAALSIRDSGGPALAGQMLVYPVTDYPTDANPSYAANGDYGLTKVDMLWFWQHWLADGASADVSTAPLRASLEGLPPAYVVTAEYDVLKDEGDAYAAKLAAAGVDVEYESVPGMMHGFFSVAGFVPAATDAVRRAARWAASV